MLVGQLIMRPGAGVIGALGFTERQPEGCRDFFSEESGPFLRPQRVRPSQWAGPGPRRSHRLLLVI